MALTDKLTAIGDAIRSKAGITGKLTLSQMVAEIEGIETGGGIDPESIFPYGGINAELVATYEETFTLADTSFVVGSTSSTTATSIKATVSNRFTSQTLSVGDKDVVVVQRVKCVPEYGSGANGKVQEISYGVTYVSHISKRRNSLTNAASETTRQVVSAQTAALRYYNSSGTDTFAIASYGLYATPQAASVASSTAANTTVRCSSPILYARASTTYAAAANQKAITDATWHWTVEVYLCENKSTLARVMANSSIDLIAPPNA